MYSVNTLHYNSVSGHREYDHSLQQNQKQKLKKPSMQIWGKVRAQNQQGPNHELTAGGTLSYGEKVPQVPFR